MDKYSILPFLISFLILSFNFLSGFYFVYIGKPFLIMVFGILSVFGVIFIDQYTDYKTQKKYKKINNERN